MSHAYVGHVDADCFYVSAERVRFPCLHSRPVGVLGNQGACVIAKSYEAKAAGVKTGMPIWEARVACPDLLSVKRDFRWYEVLSRRMLDVVRTFSPRVEYYSIDEFFFAAVPQRGLDYQRTAEALRDRIRELVGVPATVGIARTRTLAKLVSDTAKPFGALALLNRHDEEGLLSVVPITEVAGIKGRRAARLAPYSIKTCLDLARADEGFIKKLLTATGHDLWLELNGAPAQPIHTQRVPHKALSRGGSFGGSTADPMEIYAWLVRDTERLIEELEYHKVAAVRLNVWVSYREGFYGVGVGTPEVPTGRFDLLLDAGRFALRQAYRPGAQAERMHVIASPLIPRSQAVQSLFLPPGDRAEALAKLKREVNAAVGRWAVRSGATLPLKRIYDDPTNEFDICDVRGKTCF
jgi:nucleotidyltransferase/DNA polymerase involved in DNA repair